MSNVNGEYQPAYKVYTYIYMVYGKEMIENCFQRIKLSVSFLFGCQYSADMGLYFWN